MSAKSRITFPAILAAITAGGGILRLAGIAGEIPTSDDASVIWSAAAYVSDGQPWLTMPHHPMLRNLLVYASTHVLGYTAVGAKAFSLLFGTLLVCVTGLFVRRATDDERAGLFAAGFVALDIVQIVYSRAAVQDIHAAFLGVLGVWLCVEALRAEDTRRWRWLLPLAGLSFGLGMASKYYCLPLAAVSGALILYSAWKRRHPDEAILCIASLVPLPLLIYLLTYAPWFKRGYDVPEWFAYQKAMIGAMVTHTRPPIGFRANNRAWLWFIRPFYGIAEAAQTATGRVVLSVGIGNPVVWLAVLPTVAYSILNAEQRKRDWLLVTMFLASYLPFAVTTRPIWVLSSVAVIPFAAGVLGSVLSSLMARNGRKFVWAYAGVVAATSLLLYPLAVGHSLDFAYLRPIVAQVQDFMVPARW